MKRRLLTKTLLVSLAIAPLAAAPTTVANAQSVVKPSGEIVLSIGSGQLVNVPGSMADIFIANDEIADVQIKSQRQLYIFGKSGGETTLYASNARGDIIWSSTIRVGSNIGNVSQMLALAMPKAKIAVATMGDNTMLLTGTVAAPEDAAEAQRLVEAFVGEDTNVISRLRMATPLQVNLRVRFAEVSRSFVRTLGANLATADTTGGFRFGVTNGRAFTPQYTPGSPPNTALFTGVTQASDGSSIVTGNGQGSTIAGLGSLLGLDIAGALDLAETNGLAVTLSEPNLTALSGETANFLAGGEFPVPTGQGLGTTAIEFKPYGVRLAYTPVVLANGRISIRVRPEVSEISNQNAITVSGFNIPALITRRAETTVELGSGQSFMIAGLMSSSSQNAIDKTPGLGDVPILGQLFKSTNFRRGETELVIVVTPYLVKPVSDGDIKLPTDGYHAPTEVQRLIGGRISSDVSVQERPGPSAANESAASPQVSQQNSGAATTAQPAQPRRQERTAEAAAPGFSFK